MWSLSVSLSKVVIALITSNLGPDPSAPTVFLPHGRRVGRIPSTVMTHSYAILSLTREETRVVWVWGAWMSNADFLSLPHGFKLQPLF